MATLSFPACAAKCSGVTSFAARAFTVAFESRSILQHSADPSLAAKWSGVAPWLLPCPTALLLAFSSARTTLAWPLRHASSSGVTPSASVISAFAPALRRWRTVSSCPRNAALCSAATPDCGVAWSAILALALSVHAPSSSRTTSAEPCGTAMSSGVRPSAVICDGSAFISSSTRTMFGAFCPN